MTTATRTLALLLIASLAVGSVGAVTTGPVAATDDHRIAAAQQGGVSLTANEYVVAAGETVGIGVEFAGGVDSATLLVGDYEQFGYQASVSLTDGNDDGIVTVQFDTSTAGNGSETVVDAAAEADTAELSGQTTLDRPLAAGGYDLAVSTADDAASTEDDPDDTGALLLEEETVADDRTGNVSLSSEPIPVAPEEAQVIAGAIDLPRGTVIGLRVRTTDASVEFFKTAAVTVTPAETFAAEFDFSEQSPGDEFVVRVEHDGEELAAIEGRVVADATATATETATATASSTAEPTATPEPTETSIPGFGAITALLAVLAAIGVGRRQ